MLSKNSYGTTPDLTPTTALASLVAHTGFEPVISSLRGRCPKPTRRMRPTRNWSTLLSLSSRMSNFPQRTLANIGTVSGLIEEQSLPDNNYFKLPLKKNTRECPNPSMLFQSAKLTLVTILLYYL
jgi:hypothetical protein